MVGSNGGVDAAVEVVGLIKQGLTAAESPPSSGDSAATLSATYVESN